jgi:predicted esterase
MQPHDLAAAFHGCRVDLVHGEQDALVPRAQWEQNAERLALAGIAVERHLFPGGHALDPVVLRRCFG